MPAAHRRGDLGGQHSSPSRATGGSSDIFINGQPAMRLGDVYEDGSKLVDGATNVFFNGKPAARIKDKINSDTIALTGSPNVFIGDREGLSFSLTCRQAYERASQQVREILSAQPPILHPEGGIDTNRERNMINRYMRRNRLISEAYGKLYQDMPGNRWAGLAAIVSRQMGCNMELLARKYADSFLKTLAPYPTFVLFPEWIEALGEGNGTIFEALYPALRTAADQGIEQFLKCYEAGAFGDNVSDKIVAAIKKLQANEIRESAEFLARYEQKDIAQPIYEKYAAAFATLKQATDMSAALGVDLQSLPLSRHCNSGKNRIPFTKDLTNADDRINYFWVLYDHWDGILD